MVLAWRAMADLDKRLLVLVGAGLGLYLLTRPQGAAAPAFGTDANPRPLPASLFGGVQPIGQRFVGPGQGLAPGEIGIVVAG
jgi:hypothetical protein